MKIAGFVAALLAAAFIYAVPASAGDGMSEWCSDGVGTEYGIANPVTLGAETAQAGLAHRVYVCYANSPTGHSGSQVAGGNFIFFIDQTYGPALVMFCAPDNNPATVVVGCWVQGSVNPANGYVSLTVVHVTTDTALTSQVRTGVTSVTSPSVIDGSGQPDPRYPCVVVLSTYVVPTCWERILP